MNAIWTTLIIASVIAMSISDPASVLYNSIAGIDSAVSSSVVLCGVYCFWGGMFQILSDSGLNARLARAMSPIVRLLYGDNIDPVVAENICANMSANLLGISGVGTQTAITAMTRLEQGDRLSRNGAMLFVVSATSLQLLPTTVIGLRASMGSVGASDIVLPTLIATAITTTLGILLVNVAYGRAQ